MSDPTIDALQIEWLVKDHTKAELARIIVAGRASHRERDEVQAVLVEAVERALRHAQNIGIDSEGSSYVNTLRAALAKSRGEVAREQGRCPKCGGTHGSAGDCSGPPMPTRGHPHAGRMMG
jgi:hypothetical protein